MSSNFRIWKEKVCAELSGGRQEKRVCSYELESVPTQCSGLIKGISKYGDCKALEVKRLKKNF